MGAIASMLPAPAPPSQRTLMGDRTLMKQAEDRQQDQARTAAASSLLTSKMAFYIDHRNHSVTLTLSDGVTGEVVRKLIYDRGGAIHAQSKSTTGRIFDVTT